MLVTTEILERGKSKSGGWSRNQLGALGVMWPPRNGWKKEVLGKDFPDSVVDHFLNLKDAHKASKSPKTNDPDLITKMIERRERRKNLRAAKKANKERQWVRKARKGLLTKKNAAEQHIDDLLTFAPVTYRREHNLEVEGRKYFIDFLVISTRRPDRKKLRVAVEIDGGYHFTADQQAKDRAKEADLLSTSRVWSVLRIHASDAMRMDEQSLMAEVLTMNKGEVRKLY